MNKMNVKSVYFPFMLCCALLLCSCEIRPSQTHNQLIFIAEESDMTQLYIQEFGGRKVNLSKPFDVYRVPLLTPAWSPDGMHIAYIGYFEDSSIAHIIEVSLEYMKAAYYATPPHCYPTNLTWTADSARLMFTWDENCTETRGIYQIIRATGQIELIRPLPLTTSLVWSPDRTKFAFIETMANNQHLVIQDLDNTDYESIYENAKGRPTWSPNGNYIAFERQSADSVVNICWQSVNNNICDCLEIWSRHPVWNNTSNMITFRGRTDDTGHEWLGVVDLETGIVKELVSVNIDDTGVFYPVAWSFTDEFLAYEKCDRLVDARSCSIWITNQDGAIHRSLHQGVLPGKGEWEPVWQP